MAPADLTSVVLAGGFGTRIKHLLADIPKPMAPVGDRPFLEWVLRFLAVQGVRDSILSTGYRAEVIEKYFAPQPIPGLHVASRQETEPRGTAGGFLYAIAGRQPKPAAWLVTNGDSLVLANLTAFCASLDQNNWDAAILGVHMNDAARYGTVKVDAQNRLVAFHEKRPGAGLINAGVYLFRAGVVDRFPNKAVLSFETDVFPQLLAQGVRIGVHAAAAPFIDIGTPDSLESANAFIKQHRSAFGSSA